MIKNLIIVSLRNIKRNKGFTILNILGLTLAISISMLALIKVSAEFSFEKGYADYERIYRINQDLFVSDQHMEAAVTPGAMGHAIVETYPEVELCTRIEKGNATIRYADKEFNLENLVKADSTFFSMFNVEIIRSSNDLPISSAENIALSSSTAKKIFGEDNPIGQRFILNGIHSVVVTAIYADLPKRSHLKADAVVNILKHSQSTGIDSWFDSGIFTYLKLAPQANVSLLEERVNDFMEEKTIEIREKMGWVSTFSLMPIAMIRLHSHRIGDSGGGSIGSIIALILVTLIVVSLAVVNYTNMSVALAGRRAHEVGMRKISGSSRRTIVIQFLCESIIVSIIAFVISLPIAEVSLAPFSELTGMPLTYSVFENLDVTLGFLLFAIVLGIIAGFYPAFILSSFNPLKVIRKGNSKHRSKTFFRNALIVAQFAAGLTLIIVTMIVFQQRQFLLGQKMGFDKYNTIVISTRNIDETISLESLKNELKDISGVKYVSLTASNPPQDFSASNYTPEDSPGDATMIIPRLVGDCNLAKSLGVELVAGRDFECNSSADSLSILINQTLAKRMGWENPIGKRIWKDKNEGDDPFVVIGVVEDFHFESMHTPIKPIIIQLSTLYATNFIVRLEPANHFETIDAIRSEWKELFDGKDLNYSFVSDNYNQLYQSEEGMSKGFILLTVIAIFIACLGLVGLAAYNTSQRTREIGVRKVMGANTFSLLRMLWWNFIRLIGISTLIAWPIAYILAKDWLNNFAYRIDISPWVFIISAAMGVVLALASVATITYSAVRQNPAKSLKWE